MYSYIFNGNALALGFWKGLYDDEIRDLPDPKYLVRPGWISDEEKEKLENYLKLGAIYEQWRGLSYCRFRCGIDDIQMGSRDLTDGGWVWPQGLYHYISEHDVMLPDVFMLHCQKNAWAIPSVASQVKTPTDLDYTFWLDWAKSMRQS